jgi:hypothetical protein
MKNKATQGLGNNNLLSFLKPDSLKYWRLKSNVNSRMLIQYNVNQSESLSWTKLCKRLLNSSGINDMCDNWMVSFCKVFGQAWVFIF